MSTRTKVEDLYKVTYTIYIREEDADAAKIAGKDVEDHAWDVMSNNYVTPTITRIPGSFPRTVLGEYITHPDQSHGPAHFENLPKESFEELLHEGWIDPMSRFGNYDSLTELTSFLIRNPEFCVGGLFYKDEKIILTEITCNVPVTDTAMIEFLKLVRKADELDTENGKLRAWYD